MARLDRRRSEGDEGSEEGGGRAMDRGGFVGGLLLADRGQRKS